MGSVWSEGQSIFSHNNIEPQKELNDVYPIKGRKYDIRNIAEGDNVVMIELIESYPVPRSKRIYRTPLVLVIEMKQGNIRTGRHYLDPNLSNLFMSQKQIEGAYKKSRGSKFFIQ